jgi:hypothetical protein
MSKTKLTPAQIAARQANARKATGPRTDDGKARAARNSLLHGLCSRAPVLPGEDPTEFEQMLARWIHDHQPATDEERRIVFEMCCATVAIDRVRKADAAAALARMQKAGEAFDGARRHGLAQLTGRVGPRELALLLTRADGVRWLIEQWEDLAARLARSGHLCPRWRERALALLGCAPDDFADERVREVHGLGLALEVAAGDHLETHAKYTEKGVVIDKDRPMERLQAIIAGELEALRSILPDLEAEEAEQRRQAIDAVLIDTTDEGARRHRYLQDHQRSLRQLSTALIASKTARLKLYGRILSSSALRGEPDWTPPAPAEPARETPPRNEPKNDAIPSVEAISVEKAEPAPVRLVSKFLAALSPRPATALPGLA